MQTIKEYISDSRELSQTDLLYEVFATFMSDKQAVGTKNRLAKLDSYIRSGRLVKTT